MTKIIILLVLAFLCGWLTLNLFIGQIDLSESNPSIIARYFFWWPFVVMPLAVTIIIYFLSFIINGFKPTVLDIVLYFILPYVLIIILCMFFGLADKIPQSWYFLIRR